MERAALWKKAAEESEASAEGIRASLQAFISGERRFDWKEVRGIYSLSDISTWLLKSEEALEKAEEPNQIQSKEGDFWREIANQYKIAADYAKKGSEVDDIRKEQASLYWRRTGSSLHSSVDYQIKVSEALAVGKENLAGGYKKAVEISRQAVHQFEKAAKTCVNNMLDFSRYSWHKAGESLQAEADYEAKASEAEDVGKASLAANCREIVVTLERAADLYQQAAQGRYPERRDKWDSWYREGTSLQMKAKYQVKAYEIEEVGEETLAAGYREIVAILQYAADQYAEAALSFAEKKESEGDSYYFLGEYLQLKARHQVEDMILQYAADHYGETAQSFAEKKECEGNGYYFLGEKSEKRIIRTNTRVLSKLAHADSEQEIKSMQNLNVQKYSNSTKSIALSIYCDKWLTETISSEGSIKILSDYVRDVVKRGADHKVVREFEDYWNDVREAHELGDNSLALAWIQVAEGIQQAIEDSIQQAIEDSIQQAEALKNEELAGFWIATDKSLSTAWSNTVQAMQKIAEYRNQYIEASLFSQTPEMKREQKKIIEGLQSTADYLRKAAEALASKNEQKYDCFKNAAHCMKEIVKILEKLIDRAVEKQPEVSISWRKALHQYQESAECYCKATSSVNPTCYESLKREGDSTQYCAQLLEGVSIALEKATQAKEANKEELAILWLETAKQYEKSIEYHPQEVNMELNRSITDYDHVFKVIGVRTKASAQRLEEASITLEKAIQAREANQEEVAALWFETSKKNQESAENYRKAIEAKLSGNTADGRQWEGLATSAHCSADKLREKAEREQEFANRNRRK